MVDTIGGNAIVDVVFVVVVAHVVAVVVVAVNAFTTTTTTTTATTTTPTTIAGFSTLSCPHRTGPPCPGLHGLVPHGPRELHRSTQDGVGGTVQHARMYAGKLANHMQ